jgi:hypothetical protein
MHMRYKETMVRLKLVQVEVETTRRVRQIVDCKRERWMMGPVPTLDGIRSQV